MYSLRLEKLRKEMAARGLDAMLVSGSGNVRYLSGFSGSESDLVVTSDTIYLLCDATIPCPGKGILNRICYF